MGQRDAGRSGRALVATGTVVMAILGLLMMTGPVAARQFSSWAVPQLVNQTNDTDSVNTTNFEGCAMQSPDGLSLYFASKRPRVDANDVVHTDRDIYVAHRASTSDPWGTAENLGAPINTAADEFCPTPVRGGGLFFVSKRAGGGDIYFTRLNPDHGWSDPVNLGPNVNDPVLTEAGPSYFEADGNAYLYFSSGGAANTSDIFVSQQLPDGSFGPRTAVAELNSASDDFRPNVRKDGLEVVFDSNRPGGAGGLDIRTATRASTSDPWSTPTNLTVVNTAGNEARASFSWDGSTLYFGRSPGAVGSSDIYVATR